MHGLYLLWWVQERHVPPAMVAAILAAGDFALLLLEVPTGWLADRCGHRISLIVGSLVQVAGMLCCWLGQGISGLLAASVLVALGDAFRSGADEALLFRTCVALGRAADFQKLEARARAAQLAALVALVLAGGVIVSRWGFAAGWIAETVLCAIGLTIACAMGEPPSSGATAAGGDLQGPTASFDAHTLRSVLLLIVPAALLHGAASATSFLAQTAGDAEPAGMTMLVAAITLAEAVGSAVAIRVSTSTLRAQLVLAAAGGTSLVLASLMPAAFVIVVIVLSFLIGAAQPLRAAAIQQAASDRVRAQAASVAHACDMAVNLVALSIAGRWRSHRR